MIQRNDITIGVTKDGKKWIAQGSGRESLFPYELMVDYQQDLYYSQLAHRGIVLMPEGVFKIVNFSKSDGGFGNFRTTLHGGDCFQMN